MCDMTWSIHKSAKKSIRERLLRPRTVQTWARRLTQWDAQASTNYEGNRYPPLKVTVENIIYTIDRRIDSTCIAEIRLHQFHVKVAQTARARLALRAIQRFRESYCWSSCSTSRPPINPVAAVLRFRMCFEIISITI